MDDGSISRAQRRLVVAYRWWAPVYDLLFARVARGARRRAIERLALRPGDRLAIPGVGTGLDLPLLPAGVEATGLDLTPAMLARARGKRSPARVALVPGDATALPFPDGAFDAALLSLIVTVVPDGRRAVAEALRVVRPGGRVVIFDKFVPEGRRPGAVRRLVGPILRRIATDPNLRLADVLGDARGLVAGDEPAFLGGQYRIVVLARPG